MKRVLLVCALFLAAIPAWADWGLSNVVRKEIHRTVPASPPQGMGVQTADDPAQAAQGVGHELRAQRRAANADHQQVLELLAAGSLDLAPVRAPRKRFDAPVWICGSAHIRIRSRLTPSATLRAA